MLADGFAGVFRIEAFAAALPRCPPAFGKNYPTTCLLCLQKRNEISVFVRCQTDAESSVIKVNQSIDSVGQTGMEVRRPHRKAAKDRRLELAHVGNMTGDHRPPRVGGFNVAWVGTTRRRAEGSRITRRPQAVVRQVLSASQEARNRRSEGSQDLN